MGSDVYILCLSSHTLIIFFFLENSQYIQYSNQNKKLKIRRYLSIIFNNKIIIE